MAPSAGAGEEGQPSEDRETALAETADEPGTFAVGQFVIECELLILDQTRLPQAPSVFAELPDGYEYDPRPRLNFLRNISREISRPIARDDRVHIEYVPTQVVTEYVQTAVRLKRRRVDGIRYNSSRKNAKTALVVCTEVGENLGCPGDRAILSVTVHEVNLAPVRIIASSVRTIQFEPVSCEFELGLCHFGVEIENLRPETGARKWPVWSRIPRLCAAKTARFLAKPRRYRTYLHGLRHGPLRRDWLAAHLGFEPRLANTIVWFPTVFRLNEQDHPERPNRLPCRSGPC
jgi:hypothetical protein